MLLFPILLLRGKRKLMFQPRRSFAGEAIGDPARTALVAVNLTTRTFQVTVMVKPLQPPQNLLPAAGRQCRNVIGTQKTVAVEAFQNLTVAVGQPQRGYFR